MFIAKQNLLILAAQDQEGDVFLTAPKWMSGWMKENWPDAALYSSDVMKGWIETIVTAPEWKMIIQLLEKPDEVITQEAPLRYLSKETLRELAKWAKPDETRPTTT